MKEDNEAEGLYVTGEKFRLMQIGVARKGYLVMAKDRYYAFETLLPALKFIETNLECPKE